MPIYDSNSVPPLRLGVHIRKSLTKESAICNLIDIQTLGTLKTLRTLQTLETRQAFDLELFFETVAPIEPSISLIVV
jgi:hypothetical protein